MPTQEIWARLLMGLRAFWIVPTYNTHQKPPSRKLRWLDICGHFFVWSDQECRTRPWDDLPRQPRYRPGRRPA